MAKKAKNQVTETPEAKEARLLAERRAAAIAQFNKENMGAMYIDPIRVPTEEEVLEKKEEFEKRATALKEKADYVIADKDNAVRVAKFLKNYIANAFWSHRFFVGVINFDAQITEIIEDLEKEPKDLAFDYPALQFIHIMMQNPGGQGLESAKAFAEIYDEFVPIADVVKEHIDWYNAEVERVNQAQDLWGMFAQGYYVTVYDTDECAEEFAEAAKQTEAERTETPAEAE